MLLTKQKEKIVRSMIINPKIQEFGQQEELHRSRRNKADWGKIEL